LLRCFAQLLEFGEQFSDTLTSVFKLLKFLRRRLGQCGLFKILRLLGQKQAQLETDMRFLIRIPRSLKAGSDEFRPEWHSERLAKAEAKGGRTKITQLPYHLSLDAGCLIPTRTEEK
jgi:hypothetical protein